jgi:hypothetical protein
MVVTTISRMLENNTPTSMHQSYPDITKWLKAKWLEYYKSKGRKTSILTHESGLSSLLDSVNLTVSNNVSCTRIKRKNCDGSYMSSVSINWHTRTSINIPRSTTKPVPT